MTIFETPQCTPLGATGLLARFGDAIDRDLSLRIASVVDHLDESPTHGLADLVPAYTTLIVLFDANDTDSDTIATVITNAWCEASDNPVSDNEQYEEFTIPVVYGGEAGPDLDDVAANAGLSPDEVIQRHADVTYTVGALGFAPGFAFLIGLPSELETRRRSSPRTRVPAGSVAIGGAQTGIYSLSTPGGWSLIGRTPRVMFDPAQESGDELRPGDRVRFEPLSVSDAPPFHDPASEAHGEGSSDGALEIIDAGVQTSVQDLGRTGQGRLGITPGGALDRSALIAGNRLLGNPDGAAALEWTLLPPAIRFHAEARVVMTGADPGWRLGDTPVDIGEVVSVAAGDELRAQPHHQFNGARGYVCVAGGIDVPEVRGSRSLDLSAGFGGGFGRPLQQRDRVPIGKQSESAPNPDNELAQGMAGNPAKPPFRVVRGPQAERFDDAAWSAFLCESFTVDAQSNRMGLRLNGAKIIPTNGADVISEGVVTGSIQVTGSGQPIVLLPGRATIGGYTKIATVIETDHDRLGQIRPGDEIRFTEVSLDAAREALLQTSPSVFGGLKSEGDGGSAMTNENKPTATGASAANDAWTPEGVIAVIRELASQDVQAFALRVESAGLEIAIDRGGGLPRRSGRMYDHQADATGNEETSSYTDNSDNPQPDNDNAITASLLGTFYRRPSPDEPVFVEEGDNVEKGQTVGIIEVMKSFHDVTAHESGVIGRVLVEDGATVEFGQVLMELESGQDG